MYTKILNGNISFTSATESGYNGQTIMNEDGTKTIEIDRTGLSSFDLGVLLAHEANRDGVVRDNSTQERETADSVINHMDLASAIQDAYGSSYLNEANNMEAAYYKMYQKRLASREDLEQYALENYDSSADYWKLMDSGEVVWDGKKDLTNEAGETVRVDKTGSYSKSLLNWLGKKQSVALLKQRGIDTSNMSDAEIASQLMESSGVEWNSTAFSETTGKNTGAYVPTAFPGGQSVNMSGLDERLRFQLSENDAFNLGRFPKRALKLHIMSRMIKVNRLMPWLQPGAIICLPLGGVQTQAGQLLTSEQINSITETSLKNGWLKADGDSIYPTGDNARRSISQLAFSELGEFGYLDFSNNPNNADGSLIVGETVHGNNHAREGNNYMNSEIFDPYEGDIISG